MIKARKGRTQGGDPCSERQTAGFLSYADPSSQMICVCVPVEMWAEVRRLESAHDGLGI